MRCDILSSFQNYSKNTKLPVAEREDNFKKKKEKKKDINYTNLSSNQFDSNIFYRILFNLYKDKNKSNYRASYVTKIVNCMLHIYCRKRRTEADSNQPIYLHFKRPKRLTWNYWFSQHISTQYEANFLGSTWRTQNNKNPLNKKTKHCSKKKKNIGDVQLTQNKKGTMTSEVSSILTLLCSLY